MELLDITVRFNIWNVLNIITAVSIGAVIWFVVDELVQQWKERRGYK